MSETIGEALRRVAGELTRAGLDDPRLEARRIVAWAAGLDGAGLISRECDPVSETIRDALESGLAHRLARRPLAHLEGWTDFRGLRLKSDARALVPRSDSECVVDLALERLPAGRRAAIADLGTGSGCLLLALLDARPLASGTGIDRSAGAIALARENCILCGVSERAEFQQASWVDWPGWQACDLIISNPPYIASDVLDTLAPEVGEHEPRAALDGGRDGLDAYREIVSLGAARMTPGATMVLEIGHDQRDPVSALLESAGFTDLTFRRDLEGRDRAICALRPC